MTPSQFEELLTMVGPEISKQNLCREPISEAERLSLTLGHLASGDSMTSIHHQYLVGLSTVSNIISKTCEAIWNCLQPKIFPSSIDKNGWLHIAKEFEDLWNFNHCVGAIDGKHIIIQSPDNADFSYHNYKNSHSIVLLAICDAKYRFTFVDIGAYGRRSGGGIFRDSLMGQKFIKKEMNLPKWEPLSFEGVDLPYVLVGDEAFPLTEYLMRPYPEKSGLNEDKMNYNCRLSRARRTIENTFGILNSQWRILRRHIDCSMDKTRKIIQALVCLHNWLRINDEDSEYVLEAMLDSDGPEGFIPGSWRKDWPVDGALADITKCTNNNSRLAASVRDEFCHYFNSEGAVPWQFDHY